MKPEFRISEAPLATLLGGLTVSTLQSTGFTLLGKPAETGGCHRDSRRQIGGIGDFAAHPGGACRQLSSLLLFPARSSFVSGQLAFGPDGKIDPGHTAASSAWRCRTAAGQAAARLCAINILAQAKAALGDLDRISRCVQARRLYQCRAGFYQSGRRHEWRLGFYRRGPGRQGPSCKIDGRRRRIAVGLRRRDRGLV